MVRKGFWCGLSFMAGLFLTGRFTVSLWWVFALSLAALTVVGAFALEKFRHYIIACGCSFVLATAYCAAYTHFVYEDILLFNGKTVTLDATVIDYKYLGHAQGYLTVKGELGGHSTTITFFVEDDDFEYYDDIRITGKLSKIEDNYNFQSQRYYFSQGVFLKGDGMATVQRKGTNSNGLFKAIRNYSDRVFYTILNYGGNEEKGFLGAMLCGDKSEIEPVQKNMLYRSGIGHIFAVSGAHLAILTSVISLLLKRIVRRKRISAVIMLFLTWAFVIFAGMSVSVIRSAIMMSIVFAADFFSRRGDSANSLGIAGIVLCMANPYCVFSQSFLLSFSSAFAAGVVAQHIYHRLGIKRVPRIFVKGFVFSCVMSIITAPISLAFFGGFSILAPITNALLIPLCTAALVLCFIVALTGATAFVAKPLLWAASMLIRLVIAAVKIISKPAVLFITGSQGLAFMLICLICIAVIIVACISKIPKVTVSVMIAGALLCVLCSNIFTLLAYDRLDFYIFANKNNCAAIVVQSDSAVILDLSNGAKFTGAQMRVIQNHGIRKTAAVLVNNEPYYTIGRYRDNIYPQPELYLSGTQVPVKMQDAYLFDDSTQIGNIRVTRLENGFELEYNNIKYSLYPDHFEIGDEVYDTNGVSVRFCTDDNIVRRLDYELGLTDYSW